MGFFCACYFHYLNNRQIESIEKAIFHFQAKQIMNIDSNNLTKVITDNIIKLGFLAIIVVWCFKIILPFVAPVLWAILISVILHPLYIGLSNKLNGKRKLAATILTVIMLAIILVPSLMFMGSLVEGGRELGSQLQSKSFEIPPPNDQVKEWPLIGEQSYATWELASTNFESFVETYADQLASFGKGILNMILGTGVGLIQFILSVIIAGILLTYSKEGGGFAHKLFDRIMGEGGNQMFDLCNNTIRNVAKGVLGVALIQGFLIGLGFLLAGVPYAGLWALICLGLALVQLPATLVVIPVIIYLFSQDSGVMTIVWTVYLILASISDNVLKPILLGKGAPVPMLVIFLGVVGGFIVSGFIGLFVGAIVLSVGYKLMIAWVEGQNESIRG